MMSPTHLAATLVGCFLAARFVRGWDGRDWLLAVLFGVAIDLDHFFEVPAYLADRWAAQGVASLSPFALMDYGGGWTSFFHQPLGGAVVLAVAVVLGTPVPLAAWGLHQAMDAAVGRRVVEFAGPVEFAILGGLLLALVPLARAHVRERWPGLDVVDWTRAALRAALASGGRKA